MQLFIPEYALDVLPEDTTRGHASALRHELRSSGTFGFALCKSQTFFCWLWDGGRRTGASVDWMFGPWSRVIVDSVCQNSLHRLCCHLLLTSDPVNSHTAPTVHVSIASYGSVALISKEEHKEAKISVQTNKKKGTWHVACTLAVPTVLCSQNNMFARHLMYSSCSTYCLDLHYEIKLKQIALGMLLFLCYLTVH